VRRGTQDEGRRPELCLFIWFTRAVCAGYLVPGAAVAAVNVALLGKREYRENREMPQKNIHRTRAAGFKV